jgi:hypothetical protein
MKIDLGLLYIVGFLLGGLLIGIVLSLLFRRPRQPREMRLDEEPPSAAIDWKYKLTSRKLWLTVANFVTMLIVAFGGTNDTAMQVSALILAGAGIVAYIIGEGLVDAKRTTEPEEIIVYKDGSEI